MSEPVAKERPSIDLDDFERRLRQQDHRQEDPLAELARLVGENHDPYGDVFAQEAVAQDAAAYRQQGRHEPALGAPGMSPRLSGDFAAIEAGLRGSVSAHPEADFDAIAAEHEFYAQHQHYLQQAQDPYAQQDEAYLQDHEAQQWAEASAQQRTAQPASRSRRPIYAMVATIAVGVIGIGVAFAYKGSSSSPSEIRTISAASGPNKIQPPVEASSDHGNSDATALGKTGQPAQTTRLVSGEEQPVDISQAVQENNSRNPDAGGSPGDAASVPVPPPPGGQTDATPSNDDMPSFGMAGMPAPKKVKVISVRPDGTILSNDTPPAASMDTPRIASEPNDGAGDGAVPVAKTSTPKTAKSAKPKTTSRVAAKPMQLARADDDGTQTPAPKPTRKAKPLHVASAEATPATDPAGGDGEPTASVKSTGGFAVQLAAPGSESDARAASSRLAKKFASALDGRRLGFHKAESNGKSVFRVRVGSLSREDANSLCEKLKADGGSCFVAKNN